MAKQTKSLNNDQKVYHYNSVYSRRALRQNDSVKATKLTPARSLLGILIILIVAFITLPQLSSARSNTGMFIEKFYGAKKTDLASPASDPKVAGKPVTTIQEQSPITPSIQTQTTGCTGNAQSNVLIASISARHLWACNGTQVVYQTAVVTGDMNVAEDATPVGTYHIYSRQTNLYLRGSDSRGSWNDYVNYWMPFLDNQYGVFGLHDATWRAPTDFGTISQYSDNASHGCIELPLAAAAWIYNWSPVGTTVVIES